MCDHGLLGGPPGPDIDDGFDVIVSYNDVTVVEGNRRTTVAWYYFDFVTDGEPVVGVVDRQITMFLI